MDTSALTQAPSSRYVQAASRLHTILVLLILVGWAILGQIMMGRMVVQANPHRMRVYLLTLFFEWLVFAWVVAGVRRHGGSAELVLGPRWRSFRQVLRDIGIAVAFWITAAIILVILARLLHATPARQLEVLLPRGPAELALWIALSVTAGICEETIFRGYLQRQLIVFTGSVPAGILFSAAVFGAGHAYQGALMTLVIGVYGALFGILAHWRGSVRPGMIAHAWQDSLDGLAAILKLH